MQVGIARTARPLDRAQVQQVASALGHASLIGCRHGTHGKRSSYYHHSSSYIIIRGINKKTKYYNNDDDDKEEEKGGDNK